jgi:hypothetical protein
VQEDETYLSLGWQSPDSLPHDAADRAISR